MLRFSENYKNKTDLYVKAFAELFGTYATKKDPNPSFDVHVTANLVVTSRKLKTWSIFFGQDLGEEDGRQTVTLQSHYEVNFPSDVYKLPTVFSTKEFSELFERIFGDTDGVVHSLASVVFIIRKIMADYEGQKSVGNRLTRLF